MATKSRTYGRGILRFNSWETCRRPGELHNSHGARKCEESAACMPRVENGSQNHAQNGGGKSTSLNETTGSSEKNTVAPGVPTVPKQTDDKPVKLLAKYSYKGNPDRPGGFDELTVTQGEKLEFCRAHPKNPHWWEAKNTNGNVGFIPATYMMVLEDKISALPWLEDKKQQLTEEEEEKNKTLGMFGQPPIKPYVSAYGNNTTKDNASENFFCDVCSKKLNGPIPYKMHLNSKAHKEEVALKDEFGY